MVSFNYLLSVAVAIASAAPTVFAASIVEAATVPEIVTYDASAPAGAKRDSIAGRFSKRTSGGVDPYAGWSCAPWYPLTGVLSNPTCNENNCYRAFLNARNGSPGFHCPSVAYDYCCQWYSLNHGEKEYVVQYGILTYFLPWTQNCGAGGPFNDPAELQTVIAKVDDVCACTLQHKVKVTLPNDYAALTPKSPSDQVCLQHF